MAIDSEYRSFLDTLVDKFKDGYIKPSDSVDYDFIIKTHYEYVCHSISKAREKIVDGMVTIKELEELASLIVQFTDVVRIVYRCPDNDE